MNKFRENYLIFYFSLLIAFVFSTCRKDYDEELDPCYEPFPMPTGTNYVVFSKTNGDTLQYFDFSDFTEPSYATGTYREWDNKTYLKIHYNTYGDHDLESFEVEPLFNGSTSFEIDIRIIDSIDQKIYTFDRLNINFYNGYYSTYNYIQDDKTELIISNYGGLWEQIEGKFGSTFINNKNSQDSLYIQCEFSAIRWCDSY